MEQFIGECRYGQFGCDYVIITYKGDDENIIELLEDLSNCMSGGDSDALEYAQPKIEELILNKTISIIELYERG